MARESDRIFSSRPRDGQMPSAWEILRTPPNGLSGLVVLSHDVVGADVHYWAGRTRPCIEGIPCPACEQNQAPRWRGYLAITDRAFNRRCLIELTSAAIPPIDKYFRQHRTLRGALMHLGRRGSKDNGRLHAEIREGIADAANLPDAPSLKKLLAQIWQLRTLTNEALRGAPVVNEPRIVEADFGDEDAA